MNVDVKSMVRELLSFRVTPIICGGQGTEDIEAYEAEKGFTEIVNKYHQQAGMKAAWVKRRKLKR